MLLKFISRWLFCISSVLIFLNLVELPIVFAATLAKNEKKKIEKSSSPSSEEKTKYWSSQVNPSFFLRYPGCWQALPQPHLSDVPDMLFLISSDSCPKSEQGKWRINFIAPPGDVLVGKPEGHGQEMKLNEKLVKFYDQVKAIPSKEKGEGPMSYIFWTATFPCGEVKLSMQYIVPIDKQDLEKLSKDHIVPEVFKKFINGFECHIPVDRPKSSLDSL